MLREIEDLSSNYIRLKDYLFPKGNFISFKDEIDGYFCIVIRFIGEGTDYNVTYSDKDERDREFDRLTMELGVVDYGKCFKEDQV